MELTARIGKWLCAAALVLAPQVLLAQTPNPPQIQKSFLPLVIPFGETSTMTLRITNPNALPFSLGDFTAVSVSDNLPPGMVVATPSNLTNTCGGSAVGGFTLVSLNGGPLAQGANCQVTVTVQGLQAGNLTNTTTNVVGTIGATPVSGGQGSGLLFVQQPANPQLSKTFSQIAVAFNEVVTLKLTFTNQNAIPMTQLGTVDAFPPGLVVAAVPNVQNTCGGTVNAIAGNSGIGISNGTVPANSTCTLEVDVRVTALIPGLLNTTGPVSGMVSTTLVSGAPASAQLLVRPLTPLSLVKSFADAIIPVGGTTTLKFVITNTNNATFNLLQFSDTYPAGLVTASPANVTNTCAGTVTPNPGSVSLGVGIIGPNTTCQIELTVQGVTPGPWTNTTNNVTATGPQFTLMTGSLGTAAITVADLPPAITKAFAPANIAMSATSVITFVITNKNLTAMTNVAFTDPLPAGLIVSQVANVTNTCGGSFTAVSNATSVSLTGGSIPANSQCQIQVTVQAIAPGALVNTTGTVTGTISATALTGNAAAATLNVAASQVSFLIRYAANLNIGESAVNFTNTGESSTFSFGGNLAQNGEICANVFAYSPDEQLVSCCSCNVTPNALNSLSVKADLGTNTLTPIIPTSLVIKVVATQGGAACTASSAATVNTAILQPGLAAWGTSLHALPVTPGSPAGTHGVAETPFSLGTITTAELTRMAQLCAFIRANGSGYGICKSCKVGGLGAAAK